MKQVLRDKKVLIVGGSGGIGAAIAKELAPYGVSLFIHGGSNVAKLKQLQQELEMHGSRTQGLILPIQGVNAVHSLQEFCSDPDILIIAFGPFTRSPLESCSPELWDHMCQLNLAFPGALCSAYLPNMKEKKYGRILLFGGTGTHHIRGFATSTAYSAAKTALACLAQSIKLTAASDGINCNVLCPGFVQTEYNNDATAYMREKSNAIPLQEPYEIAKEAVHIILSNSINGAIIPVDNGICL